MYTPLFAETCLAAACKTVFCVTKVFGQPSHQTVHAKQVLLPSSANATSVCVLSLRLLPLNSVSQRERAVYKMRSGTRIYDLLCCLAIRPQLFEFFQKDSIPLFGDDEDVKIIDSVLSYIHKEDTDVEETIDIISFLDKGGWNSLAQQVRQGINGHFSAGSDIEAEFHALVAALWKEYGKEMPTP